jgi:outer membrane receptor protein involved in Fe transport
MTVGWAQESRATLEGRVTDPQGAVVVNATVVVVSDDTQVKQETTTNDQGIWSVRFLNPGNYTILVTAPGFKMAERTGLNLQVADFKQIDLVLEVGAPTERVHVSAAAPLIDTTSATSGTVIEPEAITEMPLLSRIPFLLATLSPGVQAIDQNQNVAMMWSNIAASEIRINGGRDNRSNEFLLDGMPNERGDRVAYIPPADSVAEFRVMSNAYDAQYGRQAGGTINVSVKSGTKNYHGNVYEFHRNRALNANSFQSNRAGNPKPAEHYHLYGATFGGPVRVPKAYNGKEKTFFFVSFEGIRNADPRFTAHSVPTELERMGDFSQSFTTRKIGNELRRYPIRIFDPNEPDANGHRTEFPGRRIPPHRLNPLALKILQFIPMPNAPSLPTGNAVENFVPNSTRQNKMASLVFRLDHTFNNEHKSFVSLRWNHMDEFTGDDFHNVTTGGYLTRISKGIGIDHVWTLHPKKILNARYNLSRFEEPSHPHGAGFNPEELGFSHDFVSKMERLSFPGIHGLSFGGIGGGFGGYFYSTYHNWNVNMTEVHGNMTFHYGADLRVLQEADGSFGEQSGSFSFSNQWTRRRYDGDDTGFGHPLASFLLGLPNGGSFPRNDNRFLAQRYYGLYFQNDWRITPRLTLNMGLRWDYERPFVERFNRMTSDFDPTVKNPLSDTVQARYRDILENQVLTNPARYPYGEQVARLVPWQSFVLYGAQLYNGSNGQPRAVTRGDFHEWQPRLGFAYRLADKTVIRGGFGRFTASSGIKGGQRGYSRSTPLVTSYDDGLHYNPDFTLADPFPQGILPRVGASLGPLLDIGQGVSWTNQRPGRPYSWEYSLHLQQEYRGWLFEVGYSHNKTYNILWGLQQNDITFDQWKELRVPRFDRNGKPLGKPYLLDERVPNPFYGLPEVWGGRAYNQFISIHDLMRPLKMLGSQGRGDNPWGKNQYDAMQVKIQRRFKEGFSLLVAYTLSKLFEDTAFWGPEISGPIPEHKLAGEDRPHKLSVAPIYELPIGRGRKLFGSMPRFADAVLGGWEISGQYTIQSGAPVVFGTDSFYDNKPFGLRRGERTLDRWFDTTHFIKFPGTQDDICAYPAWTGVQNLPGANYRPCPLVGNPDPKNGVYADFGNFVRRYPTRWANVRASRVNELNLGLFKNFKVREGVKMQFRGELFNAFNHPRFPAPNTNPGSENFGRVGLFQQNQPRIIQVALKISF